VQTELRRQPLGPTPKKDPIKDASRILIWKVTGLLLAQGAAIVALIKLLPGAS
jgi:hypothetical protein